MAFQQNFKDEEENKPKAPGQTLAPETSGLGAPGQDGAPQAPSKPTSSGSWTNLMDYVTANEGNDAAMGNKIKSGIETRATQASDSANRYQGTANQGIESGTVRDQGIIDAVKSSPVAVAKDEAQRAQFNKQWDAEYGGPKQTNEIEGYQQTGQQYGLVDTRAQNAQKHEGRKVLLEDEYARPTYTQGEKTLDSFILGAGNQGQQVLQDINQNYSNYSRGWEDVLNQVQGNIQLGQETTKATRDGTRDVVNQGITDLEGTFDDYKRQLADEAAQWSQQYNTLASNLAKGKGYGDAGIDAATANYLRNHGFDLTRLVEGNAGRSLGDLVNDEQEANYKALLDLGRREAGNYQDFSETGLGADSYYSLNSDLYGKAQQAQKLGSQVEKKLEAAQKERERQQNEVKEIASYANSTLDTYQKKELEKLLNQAGVNKNDFYALQAVMNTQNIENNPLKNLDFSSFIKLGKPLSAADVMSGEQKSAWNSLLSSLSPHGFEGDIGTANKANANTPWTFDMAAFTKALKTAKPLFEQLVKDNGWTIKEFDDPHPRRM